MPKTLTDKPRLACEITPERVIAARAGGPDGLAGYSARSLPAGCLAPNLTAANVADPATLGQAIAESMSALGGRGRDVVVVIPDAAARIVLLDFDTLPEKRAEADAMVRFRLKKSLPFEVEHAQVSYSVQNGNGETRVVAAVVLSSVLAEYESAFRRAGLEPGVVLPSMLASLGAVDASAPALIVKVEATTTSLAIVQGERLLLFRTLENPQGNAVDVNQLADDIYPSLVFFQDNYGSSVDRVLVGGLVSAEQLGAALQAQSGAVVEDLVSASQTGSALQGRLATPLLAGVVGALR